MGTISKHIIRYFNVIKCIDSLHRFGAAVIVQHWVSKAVSLRWVDEILPDVHDLTAAGARLACMLLPFSSKDVWHRWSGDFNLVIVTRSVDTVCTVPYIQYIHSKQHRLKKSHRDDASVAAQLHFVSTGGINSSWLLLYYETKHFWKEPDFFIYLFFHRINFRNRMNSITLEKTAMKKAKKAKSCTAILTSYQSGSF